MMEILCRWAVQYILTRGLFLSDGALGRSVCSQTNLLSDNFKSITLGMRRG